MSETLLRGIRVLDLSRLLPGGLLTQLLGDLGAEVIKIERPGAGDEIRHVGPRAGGTSAGHAYIDRNKRSVALDLKRPEAVAAIRRLAGASEAVVESFRPGVADRLGVGYEALSAENPALVYCSLNGYGSSGPGVEEPGHDVNYCGYAGIHRFGGPPADTPQISAAQIADSSAGALGAIGLLAALIAARKTGRGRRLEVALVDAAAWAVGFHLSTFLAGGPGAPASTATNGAFPCYQIYACADGLHVTVGALEPQFWRHLIEGLDRPDLVDRQFDPSAVAAVASAFAARSRTEWLAVFAGVDACVGPVNTLAEAVEDDHLRARGLFMPVPGQAAIEQFGCPIRVSGTVDAPRPAADEVGADTEAVLREHDLELI